MNNPDYQVVYGVGLLDDVHNYFPSLLYDQGRFQTLPQVFSYVRNQMNTRFNLFSYGASLHRGSTQAQVFPPRDNRDNRENDIRENEFRERSRLSTRERDTMNILLSSLIGLGNDIRLFPTADIGLGPRTPLGPLGPLGSLGPRSPTPDIWASFNAPVVVAPSAEIIAAHTEIIDASTVPLTQNTCSVCQDVMLPTDICRRLRPCHHIYHKSCIDQWFLRSVYCPSCRHDIRNPSPSPRLGAIASSASSASSAEATEAATSFPPLDSPENS